MAETDRNKGRNGKWWRDYCNGWTVEAIGDRDGVTPSTVSRAIQQVRDSIPEQKREEVVAEIHDFYRELQKRAMEIADMVPAPVTVGKDGDPLYDPSTGNLVRDYSGRLAAMETAARMGDRARKMLGVDAAQKVDMTVTDQAAADKAAAEAAARLEALETEGAE